MRILKNFPINGKHNKSIITDLYFNQTNKNHWLSSVTDTKAIKIGEHLT